MFRYVRDFENIEFKKKKEKRQEIIDFLFIIDSPLQIKFEESEMKSEFENDHCWITTATFNERLYLLNAKLFRSDRALKEAALPIGQLGIQRFKKRTAPGRLVGHWPLPGHY